MGLGRMTMFDLSSIGIAWAVCSTGYDDWLATDRYAASVHVGCRDFLHSLLVWPWCLPLIANLTALLRLCFPYHSDVRIDGGFIRPFRLSRVICLMQWNLLAVRFVVVLLPLNAIEFTVLLTSMSGVIGGETVLLGILALPQMLPAGYSDRKLAINFNLCGWRTWPTPAKYRYWSIYGMTALAANSIGDYLKHVILTSVLFLLAVTTRFMYWFAYKAASLLLRPIQVMRRRRVTNQPASSSSVLPLLSVTNGFGQYLHGYRIQ